MSATTIDHLAMLVGFNTISHLPNAPLIHYAADYLRELGADVTLLPDETGGKIGMHATIGPMKPGGVVLSGHSDVVPTEGQGWLTNPFTLTERNGRLYGRGAADMKGFLASCLGMASRMVSADLKRPIHIVFSYDEETTCRGILPTIDDMVKRLPPIEAVILGEPTSMRVVNAHKGAYGYKVAVKGKAAHSSLADQGVSAIAMAARLIAWLDGTMAVNAAAAGEGHFAPNYTTCHAGTISGGTACNILAAECNFEWDLRTLPQDDHVKFLNAFEARADEILAMARRTAPDAAISIVEDYAVPGLSPEPDGVAEALGRRLTRQNASSVVSYSSEGGQFQTFGLSTVLLGPGSIEQAHIADEFIEKSQLVECDSFLARLIETQAA